MNAQHEAGLPFTEEQEDWLLTEAVINWGGVIAESVVRGREAAMPAAEGDFTSFSQVAGMLGQVEGEGDEAIVAHAFQAAAQKAAVAIISALAAELFELARLLTEAPGTWEEETIQSVLAQFESPCGSQREVLAGLRALVEADEN